MVFSSSIFLFYFLPVFLLLYFIADKRYKNYIALAGSLVFYVWGSPVFLLVVAGTVILNFIFARSIHKASATARRTLLALSILANLAVLLIFQYGYFFVENFNLLFGGGAQAEISWMKYIFPLGISFITFQQLSYLIDVYRDVKPPARKFTDYALYVMLFPQLVSGPIIRFHEIAGQIDDRSSLETIDDKLRGAVRFLIGLAKKVLIADVLGVEADRIFAMGGGELTTPLAWMGALAFTFQIYYDFAGYTDMAIGLGRIMGFAFPENFNNPYVARSITEFWRRWHITLSAWLRDYIFMPLAVSMRYRGALGVSVSLLVTFVICGMWHKPGWNFILWGAYFGVLLTLEHLFLLKVLKKAGALPATVFTFFLLVIGWVLFRSVDTDHAGMYYAAMFGMGQGSAGWGFGTDFWVLLTIAAVFSFITVFRFGRYVQDVVFERNYTVPHLLVLGIIAVLLFIVSAGSIASSGFNPFIYFRF